MTYSYHDNYLELNPQNSKEAEACSQQIKTLIHSWRSTSASSMDYKVIHPISTEGYDELADLASHIKSNFKKVVIVGIGGSALNPKMTASLGAPSGLEIKYLDTTDPFYYNSVMAGIDPSSTYFLVISKSGKTIEILSILGAILHTIKSSNNFCFIVGKGDNPLRTIALNMKAKILDHDDYIGGRFATFTNVGILPGLLAGLNMKSFINGANYVILSLWEKQELSAPALAARAAFLFNKPIMVNIGYLRSLLDFFNWYSQIIAESLGKDGKGFTPSQNIGPIDQHSMFQLYLDGPRDKVFTFIYARDTAKLKQPIAGVDFLHGKTLADINDIEYNATITSCKEAGLPSRVISLPTMDEHSLGALAAHAILEVVILGHLMGINPFGQPGVEQIKNNINALL